MKKNLFVIFALAILSVGCGAKGNVDLFQKYFSHSPKWKENVTTDKYIAVFATQTSKEEYKTSNDYLLLTFTQKGKLIDSLTCGREVFFDKESDETMYRFLVKPDNSRTEFGVTQYASTDSCDMDKGESRWRAIDYRIRIAGNGKISKVKENAYDALDYGNVKMLYPDSLFKNNKTTPLGEDWLVIPMQISKEEFEELSKKSINLKREPRSIDQVPAAWKKLAEAVGTNAVDEDYVPIEAFYYKDLKRTEIRFPQATEVKSYLVDSAGKIDSMLMDSEILAVSPLLTFAGKVRQDCDQFMSIFFFQLDKNTGKVKTLAHYEDHRFCGELDCKLYWISPKELIVCGTPKLSYPNGSVYYKLRLICLAGSYLNSATPEEMQKN